MAIDGGASMGFIARHLMCQLGEFVPLAYGISYVGGWFMVIASFFFYITIREGSSEDKWRFPRFSAFLTQMVIGILMINLSSTIRSMAATVYGPGHQSFVAFCGG